MVLLQQKHKAYSIAFGLLNIPSLRKLDTMEVVNSKWNSLFQVEYIDLYDSMGLKKKPSAVWNPRSNAALERVHQVLKDSLLSFNLEDKDIRKFPLDKRAINATIGCYSPAQLVFGRDICSHAGNNNSGSTSDVRCMSCTN